MSKLQKTLLSKKLNNVLIASIIITMSILDLSLVLLPTKPIKALLYAPAESSGTTAPKTPTEFKAIPGDSQITLSWKAPTQNEDDSTLENLAGYEIYRSMDNINFSNLSGNSIAGGIFRKNILITETIYIDRDVINGIIYYYKLAAFNTRGYYSESSILSSGVVPTPQIIPTNTSITINEGAQETTSQGVILTLSATNAAQMLVGNTSDFIGVSWEPYATSKSWILTSGDGLKTVYVSFKSSTGGVSETISDTITLRAPEEETEIPEKPTEEPPKETASTQELGVTIKKVIEEEKKLVTKVDKNLSKRVSGNILLQVESHGEAWYVYPNDEKKYYLGRPEDAFEVMKKLGLGATHEFISSHTIFPSRVLGKILLDVEQHGEAYYIYPKDKRAYYLDRPADAFRIMKELGLGITNSDIRKIDVGEIR